MDIVQGKRRRSSHSDSFMINKMIFFIRFVIFQEMLNIGRQHATCVIDRNQCHSSVSGRHGLDGDEFYKPIFGSLPHNAAALGPSQCAEERISA